MDELLQRIRYIETTLETETNEFKRWRQRQELRKLLNRLNGMKKHA